MDIEGIVLCCAVVLSTGGIAFARRQWPTLRQSPSLGYLGVAWILVTAVLFLVGILSANAWARHRIRAQVANLIEQQAVVYIDGAKAKSPDRILRGLLSLRAAPGHHSHPLKRKTILISSRTSQIELAIAPDSERIAECWVYWPSYSPTLDVGRTELSDLSAALREVQE
jgi:hypothetical protein